MGAEQDTCLIQNVWCPGFGAALQPLIPWLRERTSSLCHKGLICSVASAGPSLRGNVRTADWCAFWKCFPAKLALINKIYHGKEKLVLPSRVFFVLMTNLHVQDLEDLFVFFFAGCRACILNLQAQNWAKLETFCCFGTRLCLNWSSGCYKQLNDFWNW